MNRTGNKIGSRAKVDKNASIQTGLNIQWRVTKDQTTHEHTLGFSVVNKRLSGRN